MITAQLEVICDECKEEIVEGRSYVAAQIRTSCTPYRSPERHYCLQCWSRHIKSHAEIEGK